MSPDEQARRGVHQTIVSDGLFERLLREANPRSVVTIDWGDPDVDGNYTPVFRVVDLPASIFLEGGI